MPSIEEFIAQVVVGIQSDEKLKATFKRILSIGTSTQQVRVQMLLTELEKMGAPEEVKFFVKILKDDKIANEFMKQIS